MVEITVGICESFREIGIDISEADLRKFERALYERGLNVAPLSRLELAGWVTVPREPTQQMRLAGIAEWSRPDPTPEHESTLVFNAVWRAMVAAAVARS